MTKLIKRIKQNVKWPMFLVLFIPMMVLNIMNMALYTTIATVALMLFVFIMAAYPEKFGILLNRHKN